LGGVIVGRPFRAAKYAGGPEGPPYVRKPYVLMAHAIAATTRPRTESTT
jgi:hypothetical protein